jgi:hypothetical protein
MASKTDKTRKSPSLQETTDIAPSRQLTSKEAEEDYQKQLAMLAQQEKEYRQAQGGRVSANKKPGKHDD